MVLTLALGIGANAAIFSVVRGVLLRPLVNRDENRLIYISQSARGIGAGNVAFSVPEIHDLQERVKTLSAFGDFSTIGFTMAGLGVEQTFGKGARGIACARVASEVGTHMTCKPAATFCPSASSS